MNSHANDHLAQQPLSSAGQFKNYSIYREREGYDIQLVWTVDSVVVQ